MKPLPAAVITTSLLGASYMGSGFVPQHVHHPSRFRPVPTMQHTDEISATHITSSVDVLDKPKYNDEIEDGFSRHSADYDMALGSRHVNAFDTNHKFHHGFVQVEPSVFLSYEEHGNRHAENKIVFISGLHGVKSSWNPVVDEILHHAPGEYHIITFDSRGAGLSSAPDKMYKTEIMASDTLALMNEIGLNKAHIVGVSMGGMIAMELASDYPERVASLSLITTQGSTWGILETAVKKRPNVLKSLFSKTPEESAADHLDLVYPPAFMAQEDDETGQSMRDKMYRIHLKATKDNPITKAGQKNQIAAVLSHNIKPNEMKKIKNAGFPILLVKAEQDQVIHSGNMDRLYENLKSDHTSVIEFTEAGHGVVYQHLDEVTQGLIGNFRKAL